MSPDALAAIVAAIVLVLVQFAAMMIWGSNLSTRVSTIEREIRPLRDLSNRVVRIETMLGMLLAKNGLPMPPLQLESEEPPA